MDEYTEEQIAYLNSALRGVILYTPVNEKEPSYHEFFANNFDDLYTEMKDYFLFKDAEEYLIYPRHPMSGWISLNKSTIRMLAKQKPSTEQLIELMDSINDLLSGWYLYPKYSNYEAFAQSMNKIFNTNYRVKKHAISY